MIKIYCIKDPHTHKIMYVGKTKSELHVRLIEHFHEVFHRARIHGYIKRHWFEKLAKSRTFPIIELIEECSIEDSSEKEKYWIEKLNPILNVVFANNGKMIENLSKRKSIKIYQYSILGEYIKEWNSITEAATILNIEGSNISYSATGKRKLAGNWMWSYTKETSLKSYRRDLYKKPIHKYNMNGDYICSYESGRSVNGVGFKLISKCCRGNLKSIYGFRYSFEKVDKLEEQERKTRKDKGKSRYSPILEEIQENNE